MNKYPFVKCLNPQKIVNPYTNEPIIVACGKCEACMMQKSSMRSLKCKLEGMSHKYTYFITLTYNNEHVPKMLPVHGKSNKVIRKNYYHFVDVTGRYSKDEILAEGYYSQSDLFLIRKKTNIGEFIPYLSKRDTQLFIKRLRKHISNISDEKIRYYIVGEYGPVHYRPHYHALVWFSDEKIAENFAESVHKSWKFGRIDVQKSVGQSSSYVAGYLNSSCYLPSIYKQSKTKPFACHSHRLGETILQKSKKEIYEMPAKDFITRCLHVNGVNTEFSLWRSFKTWYYPRCPQFSTLNSMERYKSYRTYEETSLLYGKASPFLQAVRVVDDIYKAKSYIEDYPVLQYFARKYLITPFIGETDYKRLVRKVYMELRISDIFINSVCDGIPSLSALHMIEKFYSDCDLLNLDNQLNMEDEFLKYDGHDIDDLIFFYDNKPFDKEAFLDIDIFKRFKEIQLNRARDSVKHKKLNDLNNIFTNI